MLFHKVLTNIAKVFTGRNLWFHILLIVVTALVVLTGFDWFYFISTQSRELQLLLLPAVALGVFVPMLVPLLLLIPDRTRITAWALGQAGLIGLFISSLYKAFTGRIPPKMYEVVTDISHGFRFGYMKGGVFWGWPSSHTTVAFAMAFTLIMLYPKNKLVKVFALIYALYIGIGISANIHWFSEFAAGAILGSVIGIVVGKSFYKIKKPNR